MLILAVATSQGARDKYESLEPDVQLAEVHPVQQA